jgi:hypothetical protein
MITLENISIQKISKKKAEDIVNKYLDFEFEVKGSKEYPEGQPILLVNYKEKFVGLAYPSKVIQKDGKTKVTCEQYMNLSNKFSVRPHFSDDLYSLEVQTKQFGRGIKHHAD